MVITDTNMILRFLGMLLGLSFRGELLFLLATLTPLLSDVPSSPRQLVNDILDEDVTAAPKLGGLLMTSE